MAHIRDGLVDVFFLTVLMKFERLNKRMPSLTFALMRS